jgi:homoserine kinase type II
MATFTRLDDRDITALAREFELGVVAGWRVIPAGTVNSNFALDTTAGRFFLRVNEGKTAADVAYEAELVVALAAARVATPCPRASATGRPFASLRGKLVSVFPWVEGAHRCQAGVSERDAHAVGRELARLHVAGAPLAQRFARDGHYTFAAIVERFEGFRGVADAAVRAAVPLIGDELDWLRARSALRAAAPHGVIHQDLFRDNVLFDAGGGIAALIDFEQACTGSLTYDLAVCINAWCYGDDFELGLVRELIAGYQEVRALAAEEREALAIECRAAALRFAVTRITDVHLQHTVSTKDFRRYLDRLVRWRVLGDAAW